MNLTQYNVSNDTCQISLSHQPNGSSATVVPLLEGSVALICFITILSMSTVVVNLIVIKTVFTTPRLTRMNAMYLAAHTAICDFIIGAFLLAISLNATIITAEKGERHVVVWETYVCPTIISIRSIGLLLEPFFLFLITLDRYKLIVNHSKPLTHLTKRFVLRATCTGWLTTAIIVGSEAVAATKTFTGSLCRAKSCSKNYHVYIERAGIAISTILFILCCGMYHRIYKVVKNQNVIMGSQAYARVSKRIFALVISTLVLWYVPAVAVGFIGHQKSAKEIRVLTILVSLTTNSLLNPFLYVFQDTKFRNQFCTICTASPGTKGSHRVRQIGIRPIGSEQSVNSEKTNRVCSTSL